MYLIEKIATVCVILPQVRKKMHFLHASGCSEMAEFNTKIKKALNTASFNQKTLADIRNLQSECKRQHDMGMSVSTISSCNKALDLVAVN